MPADRARRLLALPRNDRADLLLLALPNAALREACRRLQLTFPGYRLERVRPIVMADALAEEYETSEEDAATIDRLVDEACPLPPTIPEALVPERRIPNRLVELLIWLAAEDPEAALAPLLWRLLGHPVDSVRAAAAAALRSYIESFDQAAAAAAGGDDGATPAGPEAGEPPETEPEPEPDEEGAPAASGLLRRKLRAAESRVGKLASDIEAARTQLASERAHGARKDERLSRLKRDLEHAQTELRAAREAKAALEADLDRDMRALLRQRESQAENLRHEVESLQRKLEEARRREALAIAGSRDRKAAPEPPPVPEEAAPAPGEAAAPFQVPEFTPEFYESIEAWDDRILKSTFEKVLLLAKNFAHPSLDAKPMEGAEGLYRIKIGTDVRLLYRRKPARGIEILSLIDRENLDRYVRQYKRRTHS